MYVLNFGPIAAKFSFISSDTSPNIVIFSNVGDKSNSDEVENEIPMDELIEEFEESLEEMESEEIQTNYKSEKVNKRNPVRDKQSILSRIFQGKTDRY